MNSSRSSLASASLRFRIFLCGTFLSRIGDQLVELGMVLLLLDRFPGQLTPAIGFGIARSAILLFIGRWLGGLLDRYPTRTVLMGSVGVQMTSLLAFFAVDRQAAPSPIEYWLAGIGLGIGGFVYETGLYYTLLPQLARGPELIRINTQVHTLGQIGQVIGPALTGLAYSQWGGSGILVTDLLTFVAEWLGLWLVVIPFTPTSHEAAVHPRSESGMWRSLRSYHSALPPLVLAVGFAWCNGMSPYSTAFIFFLKEHLHLAPFWMGWVRTLGSLSAIAGAVMVPWLIRRLGSVSGVMLAGIWVEFLMLILAAVYREHFPPLLVTVMISRLGLSAFIVASTSLRQELIPAAVAGRVNGQINAFFRGMALLNMVLQLFLDNSAQSYLLLSWGTALAIGLGAMAGAAAFLRRPVPTAGTSGPVL